MSITMNGPINIFWFRRDLRLHDNAGLYHALKGAHPVLPVFIFDKNILDQLEEKKDSRVEFIYNAVNGVYEELRFHHSSIEIFYGYPAEVFKQLLEKYTIEKVFTNHDYEPYAIERDNEIESILNEAGVSFHTYKDQVIFEKNEITKDNGLPYLVFTPYSKKWKAQLNDFYIRSYPNNKYFNNLYQCDPLPVLSLRAMGFQQGRFEIPAISISAQSIKIYGALRDYPGADATSKVGIHLRFGTVSIRRLVRESLRLSDVYINELIWREFYQMILWHFPHVGKGRAFKREYDDIEWRNNEEEFERWCRGETGYPLVDAGMRQLNSTGFMHNRIRMVTASFLAKHLLIDWRWGEAYFAEKLLDYDLAANNGGWQWAAGSGCDAAPYFRIFNPTLQAKKFDPELKYIRRWVPEFEGFGYPQPVVDHGFARKRCLEAYTKALRK